ncbi:MAG: rod shape-determining protein MreC [Oceanicaulis sp.]|nr:rod shape-determining protein MreC [Oceanicaulis sp.]
MAQRRSGRWQADDGVRFAPALTVACIVIAIVLAFLDRPDARVQPLADLRAAFNDFAAPVLELAARPLRGAANTGPWWRSQLELAEENRQLRLQVSELRAWRDVALSLQERNARYREALNLQAPAGAERITAWAVADRSNAFVRSQLVGAGAESGVRPGYPAVNVYGLIGRTVDVGRTSSRVLLLTDLNSRVAVMADRSNARALLLGDNTSYPRLDFLSRDPDLVEGDRIVTTGDDNVLPRGLPVGQAFLDRDGRWRVALYSDAAPLDLVWIWPFEPVADPDVDPVPLPVPVDVQAGALAEDGETGP